MRLTSEPNLYWMTKKAWAADGLEDLKRVFRTITGKEDTPVAGYFYHPPKSLAADIVIFPDIIFQYARQPWSIFYRYKTEVSCLTHTLLHELCHNERVEQDLLRIRPNDDPHEAIDQWIAEKVLLPLESEPDDICQFLLSSRLR